MFLPPMAGFLNLQRIKNISFIIPPAANNLPVHQQDEADANSLYDLLEKEVIPLYYDNPSGWLSVVKNGMRDIIPLFDSKRMVKEYYEKLYGEK